MWLLNQAWRIWEKPIATNTKQTKASELLQDLDEIKVDEMFELWFNEKDIHENYIKIKHLTELYNNWFRITIFPKEKLKKVIKECNRELNCVINKLKQKINTSNYPIWVQALIISILNK